jgi:putative ABC transport system permease protein
MKLYKYFKSAFKHITNDGLNSFINIIGLGIGLSVFILILLYVNYQKGYNEFHNNVDQIYRVEGSLGGISPASFHPFFSEKVPQVKKGARMVSVSSLLNYTKPGAGKPKPGINAKIYAVDSTFLDIFSYTFLKGNKKILFESDKNIALSEEIAKKLFGNEDPMNKVIRYGSGEATVKAIFRDLPDQTSLPFDALKLMPYKMIDDDNWGRWFLETYFLIDRNANIENLESQLDTLNRKRYLDAGREIDELPYKINLRPYKDIYFTIIGDYHDHAKESHILIFTLVAIFVLLIACINYINLTIASASTRLKELALRKISGARRKDIIYQILVESILLAFMAVLLSVLIIEFSLPYFRNLTGKEIYIDYSVQYSFALFIVVPATLGLLAGIYPAFYISRFNLLEILKGKWIFGKSGAIFRKTLTVLQFSIAIFLITGTIFVYRQLDYIQDYETGFEKEHIISFFTNDEIREHFDSFKERLLQLRCVSGVTKANTPIHNVSSVMSAYYEKSVAQDDNHPTVGNLMVDADFMEFFDIKLLKGKGFSKNMERGDNDYMLINKKFADIFPSDTVLNRRVNGYKIIGIVEDVKTKSIHNDQQPFAIRLSDNKYAYLGYVKIKGGDYHAALNQIRGVWQEYVPEHPFKYKFLDESLMKLYEDEQRFGKAFMIFSILSIFIACLGLFALISFMTERKTKEIGIRKALGATSNNVVLLLIRQFTIWVVLANIIAWPVAYYFLDTWVREFKEHIDITVVYFVIAAAGSFLIALLTIIIKASRAANTNPVDSLRYE